MFVAIIDLYRRWKHDRSQIDELRNQVLAQEQLAAVIRKFAKDYKRLQKDQQSLQAISLLIDAISKTEKLPQN